MENIRESHSLELGKKRRAKKLELVHIDVWGPTQYHLLSNLIIILLLLMMQPEKHGFIVFETNLM